MYELALFAGAGGGILGGKLCGFDIIGAVEIEKYPREILLQRQRDGIFPEFPVWDDVCTFREDNPETRDFINKLKSIKDQLIITGGFPCQDISSAGKGKGIKEGTRSGLWFEMARIIDEIRPRQVLVENSPALTRRGLGIVLGGLAQMGYNAQYGVLGADDAGAPHIRKRIWIVANSQELFSYGSKDNSKTGQLSTQQFRSSSSKTVLDDSTSRRQQKQREKPKKKGGISQASGSRRGAVGRSAKPNVGRMVNGVAHRVDRLKSIGNGQVPAVVQLAYAMLGWGPE